MAACVWVESKPSWRTVPSPWIHAPAILTSSSPCPSTPRARDLPLRRRPAIPYHVVTISISHSPRPPAPYLPAPQEAFALRRRRVEVLPRLSRCEETPLLLPLPRRFNRRMALSRLNKVCAQIGASVSRRALYLLDQSWPVFLSEFVVDNRGGNVKDNRYYGCDAAVAADLDLDWALWTLPGSYYFREGVLDLDEVYGVLDRALSKPHNETALRRIQALQRPRSQRPGYAEAAPYTVQFHPATGLCVVPLQLMQPLELGLCAETQAWAYEQQRRRLALRDRPLMCLYICAVRRPARAPRPSVRRRHVPVAPCVGFHAARRGQRFVVVRLWQRRAVPGRQRGRAERGHQPVPCQCLSADSICDRRARGSSW